MDSKLIPVFPPDNVLLYYIPIKSSEEYIQIHHSSVSILKKVKTKVLLQTVECTSISGVIK
jgi:hypothetical protein